MSKDFPSKASGPLYRKLNKNTNDEDVAAASLQIGALTI
jgi:hypothetical protein